jgi:DNA (cytosine-5)-methyltransferase 1
VSLFSGCGGLDAGITAAGFDVVLGADNDPLCAKSHRENFPQSAFFEGSVSTLTASLIDSLTEGKVAEGVDLLVGGPPCPPFSKSRFYLKDKPRALDDELAMDTIGGYLNVLSLVRPRAFLLENVPGMAYDVHRDALDWIVRRTTELGYQSTWRILNAADYGVPQIRHRFFMVGTLDAQPFAFPTPTHRDPAAMGLFENDLPPWRTAGQVLADLDTDEMADDSHHFAGGKHHDLLEQIPPGDNYLFFTEKRGHPNPQFRWRSRYWSFLLKLSPDKPAWTIQARRSNNMGPFHWRNRILRIEEIKRLQAFADDWYVSGTNEQAWRQIGNAVPPLLAQRLGDALAQRLSRAGGNSPGENGSKTSERKRVLAGAG